MPNKGEKWVGSFARYFGIYYEWLLAPWLITKRKILAGSGMKDDKDGAVRPEPLRPSVTLDNWRFVYDWLVEGTDGKVALVESKCWIAFTNFESKFEKNDFNERFKKKYDHVQSERRNDEGRVPSSGVRRPS